jgi:iron-sulfur cluster assembly protein
MVTVSEKAANKLNSLIEESGFKTPFVRVAVKGGGCSGLSYDLSFDTEKQPADTLAENNGVKILIDNKSLLYLFGTELDFSDGLDRKSTRLNSSHAT